jgi:hypothetical protein
MSTTTKTVKTTEERVAAIDAEILQRQNKKKKIMQQAKAKERKERNHRLYRRHGHLEMFLPELINMTDHQFEMFIKRGIKTKYGIKILYEILGEPIPKDLAEQFGIAIPSDNGGSANPPKAEQSEA